MKKIAEYNDVGRVLCSQNVSGTQTCEIENEEFVTETTLTVDGITASWSHQDSRVNQSTEQLSILDPSRCSVIVSDDRQLDILECR
jgi:hypothetical protein